MTHQIERHSRQVLETTMTSSDLLDRAVNRGRLPARRFRVEGAAGMGGTSRLLGLLRAQSTAACYGGRVHELVTAEMFLTAQAAHLDLPLCARCKAPSRQPCRIKGGPNKGAIVAVHACRLPGGKMTIAEQAVGKGFCGACSAPTGEPCKTPKSTPRRPHKGRPDLAPRAGA